MRRKILPDIAEDMKESLNLCQAMFEAKLHLSSDDLMLSSALPADKYKLVKYEDLVSDPRRTMLDLYSFAGIPVTQQMLVSINQHFNAELLNKKRYTIT